MAEKAQDLYGTFGSVPTVSAEGGGGDAMRVDADASDFGGQVGAAERQAGNQALDLIDKAKEQATHYSQIATEAQVNDDYANKYIPAATALRSQYDQLQGQDKVHGYENYISSLNDLGKQYSTGMSSPYGSQLMQGQINRHIANETEGASRELASSQIDFSNRATSDKIEADTGYATNNYNNPQIVDQTIKSNNATILMNSIDNGMNPNNPDHKALIEQQQADATGKLAVGMINSAVSRGDAAAANKIRSTYGPVIPGYQQLSIDNTLHQENMRQMGANSSIALKTGQPIPQPLGYPPSQVQAAVANTAQSQGIDPNHALTVAMIESNMGRNLGTRGDIGQTGQHYNGDVKLQAANMVQKLKHAGDVTSKALGRPAEPWEQYATYQQGDAGGPALMKAAKENPTAKAVDILAPLYKNNKSALEAVTSNGGNATMTSGDFLSFLKNKYTANAKRSHSEFPDDSDDTAPRLSAAEYLEDRQEVADEGGPLPMEGGQEVASADKAADPENPKTSNYSDLNTKLSPEEETKFQEWKSKYAPKDSGDDYDLRGAFKEGLTPDPVTGHWPDTYKKPNHPTFSDQSKFAKDYPDLAGKWAEDGTTFIPPDAPKTPGQAIMDPHEQTGEVVQPAANPRQALNNFDEKLPGMMDRANAIPNLAIREAVLKNIRQDRELLSYASTGYSSQLINGAQKLAEDPKFTSMDQVPAEMASSLLESHPETMHYLELRANQNLEKQSGGVSKDMKEYGPKVFDLMRGIHDGTVKSPTEIMKYLPNGDKPGEITLAGYDRLVKEFTKDPESQSEGIMKTQAFKVIKRQLSGEDDLLGITDPKGEALFSQALPKLFSAIDAGKAKGLTMGEMTDPSNPNWIGNTVSSLKRTPEQQQMDMFSASSPAATDSGTDKPKRTLNDIIRDAQSTTDPAKKAAFKKEAMDLGFIRADDAETPHLPQAPIAR